VRIGDRFRGVVVAACAALALAGCSLPFFGPSAQDLAIHAYQGLRTAKTVHLKGGFTAKSKAYVVDVVVEPKQDGGATGSGSYGGVPFKYINSGKQTYLAGSALWQTISGDPKTARVYGEKWIVATPQNPVVAALVTLNDLGGIEATLSAKATTMQKGQETTVDGTRTAVLSDGKFAYFVSESDPMRLVRIQVGAGRTTSEGLSSVKLDLHYDSSSRFDAGAPPAGQFIDPGDPATMPALYELVNLSGLQNCGETDCGFTATVRNDNGPPEGQTVATLILWKDQGHSAQIGSCQAPVPALAHGQTGDVSCRISGAGWNAFYAAIPAGGSAPLWKDVTFHNPPYDA
jgi:hypothetical protein